MMNKFKESFTNPFKKSNFKHTAGIVIGVVVLVGVIAMFSGTHKEDPDYAGSRFSDQNARMANALDYYHCQYCNTIVPCPYDHNGNGIGCPSCGLGMNVMRRRTAVMQGAQGSNFDVAGGFGRNGGLGLGPGGNLVCPDCGYITSQQRGVPCYTVQCPKCGSTMVRQLTANVPTAFNTMRGTIAGTAPPIRIDAVMRHEYRGVCSKCHQIIGN